MQPFDLENLENAEINIYLKYYQLDTEHLTELLNRLDRLYKRILDYSYPIYYSEKYDQPFRNFLEISNINTGESIKIRLKEGWKPEFHLRNSDIEIGIPRKLGIPAIILYLVFLGAQKIATLYNDTLDIKLKNLDLKLKEMELHEKMIQKESFRSPYSYRRDQRQADELVIFLLNNPSIYYIEINGITIKDEK